LKCSEWEQKITDSGKKYLDKHYIANNQTEHPIIDIPEEMKDKIVYFDEQKKSTSSYITSDWGAMICNNGYIIDSYWVTKIILGAIKNGSKIVKGDLCRTQWNNPPGEDDNEPKFYWTGVMALPTQSAFDIYGPLYPELIKFPEFPIDYYKDIYISCFNTEKYIRDEIKKNTVIDYAPKIFKTLPDQKPYEKEFRYSWFEYGDSENKKKYWVIYISLPGLNNKNHITNMLYSYSPCLLYEAPKWFGTRYTTDDGSQIIYKYS
jgi:hypothetical protein